MFLTVVAAAVHASQDVLESVDDFLGMDEFSRLDQGLHACMARDACMLKYAIYNCARKNAQN